jgi:hypothetical protein
MIDWNKQVDYLMKANDRLWQDNLALMTEKLLLEEKVRRLTEYIKGLKNNRGNLGGNADGRQCI